MLEEALGCQLCVVSGGLGPTHDDRTVELVARAAGRRLVVDEALRAEIEAVSRRIAERLRRPYAEFEGGVVKQATLPEGALSLGLAGTAPGRRARNAPRRRRVPAGPARGAAAALGRARSRRSRCGACSSGRAPPERRVLRLLRRQRVGGRAGARGGGRGGAGRRGDDLRPRLRDPRRSGRGSGRGCPGRRTGGSAARAARALPLRRGRAARGGDRARPRAASAGSRSPPPSRSPAAGSVRA